MLTANIVKDTATAENLTQEIDGNDEEITEYDEDISVWNGNVKGATKVRKMEKTVYHVVHKNYSEPDDALERARLISDEAKKLIDAFLQQDPEEGRIQRRVWQLAHQKPMHTSSSLVVLLSCSRSSLINSLRSEPLWRRRK